MLLTHLLKREVRLALLAVTQLHLQTQEDPHFGYQRGNTPPGSDGTTEIAMVWLKK